MDGTCIEGKTLPVILSTHLIYQNCRKQAGKLCQLDIAAPEENQGSVLKVETVHQEDNQQYLLSFVTFSRNAQHSWSRMKNRQGGQTK